ncbi:peptidoglycan DD-metalloendopeptidase family protein [Mucilaginibacter sp.]|jgi:murein DD-endopeptidase MepM/ murein hydrolase activator NlpD|uniref:peptidoglycan DD-metalloendopeptidase family protein n=1 Tax=Mucilaginibacter sp. TaxID=1882438 RepID=UPI002C7936E6|nr:peptidoglycan DD-metalloendopeptidase family protein [Mucilaginibacter sp.]HTI60139.1 peptidoglycan DD-metalloendopeptidase family protein [Mucilaginibacter sp.]
MNKHTLLENYIRSHPAEVGKVVDYTPGTDLLYRFDFTAANTELSAEDIEDTSRFSAWITTKLKENNCSYGIGGYMEHRTIYARSAHFNTEDEPRRLHLGVDIWAGAGTPVYAPMSGYVHSFQDNNNHGDYGPTIILQHDVDGLELYSLYGHLSRKDLVVLHTGDSIEKGQQIGTFGNQDENGHWPPHLHFQLMFDMEDLTGDYPGVAKFSEKEKWLKNIPDPNLILRFPNTE